MYQVGGLDKVSLYHPVENILEDRRYQTLGNVVPIHGNNQRFDSVSELSQPSPFLPQAKRSPVTESVATAFYFVKRTLITNGERKLDLCLKPFTSNFYVDVLRTEPKGCIKRSCI
jgi:hypothetical protein